MKRHISKKRITVFLRLYKNLQIQSIYNRDTLQITTQYLPDRKTLHLSMNTFCKIFEMIKLHV